MIRTPALAALVVSLAGVKISYTPFDSGLYPYRIDQPSSFKHYVLPDSSGRQIDYFAPGVGSFVTNVNIYAEHGPVVDDAVVMRANGARNVHRSGVLVVNGRRLSIICGDWHTPWVGSWREEQVEFSAGGEVWHLTASYAPRFQTMRSTMLHMLHTFRLR